jgi:hypothetical protein
MLVIQYPCIITLQNNLDERLNESVLLLMQNKLQKMFKVDFALVIELYVFYIH